MLRILHGDCRVELSKLEAESFHACVTDPPYELDFMGKAWDGTGVAFDPAVWREVLRVLKPGGHLLAFGGTRTYHRMVCAIEDAGFEIRDQIAWVYGSGFPKSLDVGKAIDREAGVEREVVGPNKFAHLNGKKNRNCYGNASRPPESVASSEAAKEWEGWGTALKPAWEPIVVARKPLVGTVAQNVQMHGAGGLNIDGCRVPLAADDPLQDGIKHEGKALDTGVAGTKWGFRSVDRAPGVGRFPANLVHDGSDEVVAGFPSIAGASAPVRGTEPSANGFSGAVSFGGMKGRVNCEDSFYGDSGSAARFFYCAKASGDDREDWNDHPTVKPTALMRWLCRLVTPKGGSILDPFAGSGTTGRVALEEGFGVTLVEMDAHHIELIRRRTMVTPGFGF